MEHMADTVVEALIVDLLEWVAKRDRSYDEVMDAWRTSCPNLPAWEDANDRGLIRTVEIEGRSIVRITPSGRALLDQRNRQTHARTIGSRDF
jgi:D-3-phosphoglycerate dehydrogenase